MDSIVNKWGNSIGIRIPQSLANKAGITEGTPITIDEYIQSEVMLKLEVLLY